jgi:DNA-binding NtrC family response regulator
MRECLDCAVLTTDCTEEWISPWFQGHIGGRLNLHRLAAVSVNDPDSVGILAASSMRLRRFDACLLPVAGHNLGWARTALLAARGAMHTPVLALVHNLKAAALNDLYSLGLADFIRVPICTEEVRVRVERLLDDRRYLALVGPPSVALGEAQGSYSGVANPLVPTGQEAICATILDRSGAELEAFAVASASRCATTKESFRTAKSKVIERFERAYITAALGRHSGNIAMAARAAQKHRRAFWALMRKHDIEAAPFRNDPSHTDLREG